MRKGVLVTLIDEEKSINVKNGRLY